MTGLTVHAAARRIRPHDLIGKLPLVPLSKRDRALLVTQALMAAVVESAKREIANKLFDGVPIGCFPDLYGALSGNMPDQVITL